MKATEVTAGLAESNGSLLPGLWRDSLHVTCELTACTPGSALGPTLGNVYGKTLPFYTLKYSTTYSRPLVYSQLHNFVLFVLILSLEFFDHVRWTRILTDR